MEDTENPPPQKMEDKEEKESPEKEEQGKEGGPKKEEQQPASITTPKSGGGWGGWGFSAFSVLSDLQKAATVAAEEISRNVLFIFSLLLVVYVYNQSIYRIGLFSSCIVFGIPIKDWFFYYVWICGFDSILILE